MARNEQKLSLQSPLSLLVKQRALKQSTLPGFPAPHETSPLSLPRIAFILRRGVETIQSVRDRIGKRWSVKTEHTHVGFTSSLSWRSVADELEVTTSQTLRGKMIKLTQEGVTAVFTNEHGATLRYSTAGQGLGSPTPLRRSVEQAAQTEIPWYQKTFEAVGRSGIRLEDIEAEIIEAPAGAGVTKNDKPVARFKLRMLHTAEQVELSADVYNDAGRDRGGNPYRIQQTLNKKLKAGDTVVFTGHYHIDRTTFQNETGVKPFERRWIRLLVIERKATG